ncbi:IQ and ubiquitin-like domain-containing protein [Cylas formicarius]|uniref:IQ and ubiquitin-like domain-containing protein n=1 Tax=Cylas formicarius TaxID=197179 RepID=UPI00295848B8|nr:IQ and ubiquitin-like domain-containing protein [Cylas formicarius]
MSANSSLILDQISEINFEKIEKASGDNLSGQVTVKFYTTDAKVFTQSFPGFYNISFIKRNLSNLFGIPSEVINLLYKDEAIDGGTRLEQFKPDRYGILEFKILSGDKNYKIHIENAYKDLTVPDILTVKIQKDDRMFDIVVEIENQAIEKPYLGGYRNIQTGIQYHHGFTQTGPLKLKLSAEMKNHRDTQTYITRNRTTEKDYSRAIQVSNKEIYIPNICDKILTPGTYETAEEREKRLNIEGKIRIIQRYYYSWKMRKCLKQLREEYHKRLSTELARIEAERLEDEERRKKDLVKKVFPMKPADFAMLYSMVDRWKKSEIERITSLYCGAAKISEFYLLLDREIEILQSIEKLRMKVKHDLEINKVINFFKQIGKPIEWDSEYKHIHIQMDTLEAQKGREYFTLYRQLCEKNNSLEDKLQTYWNLKEYLKKHYCSESAEIIGLINRVSELLVRGISIFFLTELEKRIKALVLHHFKITECNEGVTNHMNKVKLQNMTKDLVYCQNCHKLKPIEAFTIHARLEKLKTCTNCKWLNKAEEPWIDLSPHKFILKQIRNYERLHHGTSSVVFILQDRDIHFIINYIWHNHSALSECNDIYELRLVRWKKDIEWSPWNCILLTVEESKVHLRILNLDEVYEQEFISHIFNKHALAKQHFPHLLTYNHYLLDSDRRNLQTTDQSEDCNSPHS